LDAPQKVTSLGGKALILFGACSSGPVQVGPKPPANAMLLSTAQGSSCGLLLFNLLPIFPLDGGQLMQSLLWRWVGHYRSMMIACNTGLIGSLILGIFGILHGPLMILWIAIMGGFTCWQQKQITREMGPHGIEEDYSSSLRMDDVPRRRRLSRRSIKKAQKRAAAEQAEQARIDSILEKVSAHGMQSLTWWEKRTLRKATERQRQRDFELSRNE